jgi:TatA/E family protein of Tat protein translocase
MFGLGIGEIVVVLFIALIFIGPKKLPGLAKGLGKGIREFQNAANGIKETIQNPDSNTQSKTSNQITPMDQPEVSEELPTDVDPSHQSDIKIADSNLDHNLKNNPEKN